MTIEETINRSDQTARNAAFSPLVPKLQLAWDATSYTALCKCPRYYELAYILGYASPFESDDLKFGFLLHSAGEIYDHSRAQGTNHETALLAAVRYAIIETWDFSRKRPWASEIPEKTRNTLLRSIVWYLDNFQNDHLKTVILANGKPAVELSFRFNTEVSTFLSGTEELYALCGHLDKVVDWNDQLWIVDKKTTRYALDAQYFRQYTPNNQVSLYSLAGRVALAEEIGGLIIDGLQVLVTGTRFRRQPIPRSDESLEEWLRDFEVRIRENEIYVRNDYWPQNPSACGFGRRQCTFRPVCSAEPSMRPELLDTLYVRRVWDPLQPR